MYFTIVIATCNRPDRLSTVLCSVKKASEKTGEKQRVIIVDNGDKLMAKDAVETVIASRAIQVEYVVSAPRNKSKALNTAIGMASTEWLAFTDDDALPSEKWLIEAEKYIQANSNVNVFGGRIIPVAEKNVLPSWLRTLSDWETLSGPAVVSYDPMVESGLLSETMHVPFGANVFIRKSLFTRCGGYDEELWLRCGKSALGCEDAELSMRLRSCGESIGYCRSVEVLHPIERSRVTVWWHLVWSWRAGVRESVLFRYEGPLRPLYYSFVGACMSGVLALYLLVLGRNTESMRQFMLMAKYLGQQRGIFVSKYHVNLWVTWWFPIVSRWAIRRILPAKLLGDYVTWYYKNARVSELVHFYGDLYFDGYALSESEERKIKYYQSVGIAEALPTVNKILVVGCSNGMLVDELRHRGKLAFGLDVSPSVMKFSDDKVKDYIRLGSVTKLPYTVDDGFDAIVAVDVMEHIPAKQVREVMLEMYRLGVEYLALVVNHNALTCLGHVTMKPFLWWERQFSECFVRDPAIKFDKTKMPLLYSVNHDPDGQFTFWRRKRGTNEF